MDKRCEKQKDKDAKDKSQWYYLGIIRFESYDIYALKVMDTLVRVYNLQIMRKAMDIAYGLYLQQKSIIKYIYETMDKTKEIIQKSFNINKEKYIDKRWECQLHHQLHEVVCTLRT